MKVTMLLADSAQAVGGKLYVLGGGWSMTGPKPSPSALAMKFEVPWDRANERFHVAIELLDADGDPVTVDGNDASDPVRLEAQLETGRPAGLKPGTPLDAVMALNFGPLPLRPDSRFQWRLSVNGEYDEDWTLSFGTRPEPRSNPPGD